MSQATTQPDREEDGKQNKNNGRHDLRESLHRLGSIQRESLSLAELQKMQYGVRLEYTALAEKAVHLEHQVASQLERGDLNTFDSLKKQLGRLRSNTQELEEEERKLENEIQRWIMRDGMARVLGSHRRLKLMEGFSIVLIVFVLALLFYDLSDPPDRPDWASANKIFLIDTACCMVFLFEFFLRLKCAESKRYVWRHHWVDFVTSIPIPGEAQLARFGRVFRLARVARALRLLRLLRLFRIFFLLWRGLDKLQDVVDVKLMKRSLRWGVAVMLFGALLIWQMEGQGPDGAEPVRSLGLSLWWSFTTVVTGGFGDIHNPNSTTGMLLTATLVITGMVLVGVFTATLTTLLLGEQTEEIDQLQQETHKRLDQIARRVDQLVPSEADGTHKRES